MKRFLFLLVLINSTLFISCNDDDESEYADYIVATPLLVNKAELRASVTVTAPIPTETSGKIYAYNDYIFINEKYKGVHIIDNSNPENPSKIGFITIPGNVDISVKDNFLYADSVVDLVVLDISNSDEIKEVNRLENALPNNVVWPIAEIYEYAQVDYENQYIIGWETKIERRKIEEVGGPDIFLEADAIANQSGGNTGQGGSLARFKIVDEYLYAVDSHNINVFNISNLNAPEKLNPIYAGFDIETIFNKGDYLYLGSMQGMFIYNLNDPAMPSYVSEFRHGTACDPVVVDDNYAYVTLRGGNFCGATESGLYIVDLANIEAPELKVMYPMDEPYGLGIKGNQLFICDGASGLKVYDTSRVPDLPQLNHFKDIVTFDVIPLEEQLLMVGDGVLYQYTYTANNIKLLSEFRLN
ncbi:hypothetical protein BUL40_10145 [Croceivirga radicis]|uniref:LVIVD repeat-containing protein n=1 Tax=Croceivirga radicis TaxID=1929488 RepID=A0A1V6LQZ0_9FLAO|nr:hypothetical protein [Croceivirga radicis]OQD42604.1 hypothetical protein BUL40_10145 [Croceivirga radicis]